MSSPLLKAVQEVQHTFQRLTKHVAVPVSGFEPRLVFPDYRVPLSDFQGHHRAAFTRMKKLAPEIDLVIELRDSRAPLTTTNYLLEKVLRGKPKIVLYTKTRQSILSRQIFDKWNVKNETWGLFDNKREDHLDNVVKLIKAKCNEMEPLPPLGMKILVAGMPNVGKSTLVNRLRRKLIDTKNGNLKDVARVERRGGTTRAVSELIKLSNDPLIYIHDTPGVMLPSMTNSKSMLIHSLLRTVDARIVDPVISIDYFLYLANIQSPDAYLYRDFYNTPTNDVNRLLESVARSRGLFKVKTGKNKYKKVKNMVPNSTVDMKAAAILLQEHITKSEHDKVCFDMDMMRDLSPAQIEEILDAERDRVMAMELDLPGDRD
ncbi:hypothetical protein OGAPHI_005833 [Ogataea philodendri]|uniref:G domain-containing protein n=1 Tax=Ogataea philodendri TaxID=1378263 RepID=A0A9P8T1J0_9ASCO|nr:uncharacterized protein OGAPHI_005833 [Ogataea philodendri]KAH3662581.1 hypothetical protein OGAPHI_005833 [Ogataea philodendri]